MFLEHAAGVLGDLDDPAAIKVAGVVEGDIDAQSRRSPPTQRAGNPVRQHIRGALLPWGPPAAGTYRSRGARAAGPRQIRGPGPVKKRLP